MPNLKRYHEKRDPDSTPEPFFSEARGEALAPGAWRSFVVQQHAATRMHWDLRLEIDGVLVSWAVPKGPSLDPAERRLAVQTEDHPIEYADFEGVIPAGNYGAGPMIVWDHGSYPQRRGARSGGGSRGGEARPRASRSQAHRSLRARAHPQRLWTRLAAAAQRQLTSGGWRDCRARAPLGLLGSRHRRVSRRTALRRSAGSRAR